MINTIQQKQNFFNHKAASWDYHQHTNKQVRIRSILNDHIPELESPVLDLGCGSGILLNVLPRNLKIFELDFSLNLLNEIKYKHPNQPVERIHADAQELPLKPDQLETVICFQSFPHFPHTNQVISEVWRILDMQGIWIILHLMDHFQLNDLHQKAGQEVAEDVLPAANVLAEQLEKNRFSVLTCKEEKDLYLIIVRKIL